MALPPADRPEPEHAISLGIIVRVRILKVVGKVADMTATVATSSYADINYFEGLLQHN